ncbi:MAG: hypothetical protein WA138_15970 [Parvibaculum sp.]
MNRSAMMSILLWALIAGGLTFFFHTFPDVLPLQGVALLVPTVLIFAFYVGRSEQQEKESRSRIFGRFSPKTLMMVGAALFAFSIAWIVLVTKVVLKDADEVFLFVVLPVLAMIALGSIFVFVGLYGAPRR